MQRRTPVQRRGPILLAAAAVGAMFVAGLAIHGWVGAVLLLLTDVVLATSSVATWTRVRPQGRPFRVVIIALILVLAIVKIARG